MYGRADSEINMFNDQCHVHLHERTAERSHQCLCGAELHDQGSSKYVVPMFGALHTDRALTATAKYSEVTCGRPERDRSDEVSVTAIVGCALATVSVILRIISRWTGAGGQWGIDDFIIVPAMFVSITVQPTGLYRHMLMY